MGRKKVDGVKKVGRLVHGNRSEIFKNWLKKHGLDLPDLPEFQNWIDEVRNRIAWLEIKRKELEFFLDFYRNVGTRGLMVFDELIDLESQIAAREMRLRQEGKDPLEDEALQKAKQRKFEILKFLEKIKWDKEKFIMQYEKDTNKVGKKKDLFTIETNYWVDEVDDLSKDDKGEN